MASWQTTGDEVARAAVPWAGLPPPEPRAPEVRPASQRAGGTDAPAPRNLHLVMEATFTRDRDGRVWCRELQGNEHWSLVPGTFDHVCLVARVLDVDEPAPPALALDPARVTVVPLPPYRGLVGLARVTPELLRRQWAASRSVEVALLRLPGPIGSLMGLCLAARGRRFAIELLGDIDGVLGTAGFGAPTRLIRVPARWLTRYLCRTAGAVSYVTRRALQAKYPSSPRATRCACSDVNLEPTDLAPAPRRFVPGPEVRVVFSGSLARRYKGGDVLVDAVARLRARGVTLRVRMAGDGFYRAALAEQIASLGLGDRIELLGHVPRPRLLQLLDEADLFVIPSRTEGLPRALVEAMAKGLPCVGSRVGGIPELLSADVLVPADDAAALADAIARLVADPARMDREAARNLTVAREFTSARLFGERMRFLHAILGPEPPGADER